MTVSETEKPMTFTGIFCYGVLIQKSKAEYTIL